jgi:hypothetical protein
MSESEKPPCQVSRVSFRIWGNDLDLKHISRVLGVQPTNADRSESRDDGKDLWCLSSPLNRTEPINAHIRWLRQALEPHLAFLRSFQNEAELRIYCGLTVPNPPCKFSFSPEELKMLVDLEIPLEVTVLF